jgi:hypothetical protein
MVCVKPAVLVVTFLVVQLAGTNAGANSRLFTTPTREKSPR